MNLNQRKNTRLRNLVTSRVVNGIKRIDTAVSLKHEQFQMDPTIELQGTSVFCMKPSFTMESRPKT